MKYVELEEKAKKWNGKVCIFGAGWIGKTWGYDIITLAGFKVDWYCDNKLVSGKEIRDGIRTINFEKLCEEKENTLVFVAVNEKLQDGIESQLLEYDIRNYVMMGYLELQELCVSVIEANDMEVMQKYRKVVDDEEILKIQFKYNIGEDLRLDNPLTFNEKLQWLKLNDHNEIYKILVDKSAVKKYVHDKLGKEYIIPTLGEWNSYDDINFDELPEKFVLKCTHDSGSVVLVESKENFDSKMAKVKLEKTLKIDFFWHTREWPYKDIPKKIIAEPYIGEKEQLVDYKFMCFNGKVKSIFTCTERFTDEKLKVTFFDLNWNKMNFERKYPASTKIISKPQNLDLMIKLSEILSDNLPFVRVDFYEVKGKVYFGEMTFYPGSGNEPFEPKDWDLTFGNWIKLND